MTVITYGDITPSLVENTTIQKLIVDGVHKQYNITPNKGYVLHDKDLDSEEIDTITFEPTGEIILGFYAGTRSVRYDYDFAINPREFYAVSETEEAQLEETMPMEGV